MFHVSCALDKQTGASRSTEARGYDVKPQTSSRGFTELSHIVQEAGKVLILVSCIPLILGYKIEVRIRDSNNRTDSKLCLMQIDNSPQAEQHRALHSLAELFPPQHVEGLNPALLLYFPIGMALRPPYLFW